MERVIRSDYLNRLIKFKDMTDLVKVITGVRRCGKSTLLMQFMDHLLSEGISKDRIVYMNFESSANEKYLNRKELLRYILDIWGGDRMYILLDEIQRVHEWELAINSLLVDTDADIYLTGSNAYFLSTDLSTYLTGRCVSVDMLPLSFKEFRELNGNTDMRTYLNIGGMPIIRANMDYEDIQSILNGITSAVLLNDVVSRNDLRNTARLMKVAEYIFSEIGNLISAHSISKQLGISDKTADSYLRMLEESLIVVKANRFDMKGRKILQGTCKYYATDNGMRNAYLRSRDRDIGRLAENIVFLELKRRGYRVAVGKYGNAEIDFTADRNGVREYYQVSMSVTNEAVFGRETGPLDAVGDNYPKTVITLDRPLQSGIRGIRFVSLEEFLLE